jgi:hypothetical protein
MKEKKTQSWDKVVVCDTYEEAKRYSDDLSALGYGESHPRNKKQVKIHRCGDRGSRFKVMKRTIKEGKS